MSSLIICRDLTVSSGVCSNPHAATKKLNSKQSLNDRIGIFLTDRFVAALRAMNFPIGRFLKFVVFRIWGLGYLGFALIKKNLSEHSLSDRFI